MPERNTIVVADSRWETVTEYLSAYSVPVLKQISRIGTHSVVISGKDDTRENFEAVIREYNPAMVLILSHGLEDITTGYENQVILDSKNAEITKDRTIFILSCLSGKKLGPILVEKGCNSVIAFKEEFLFFMDSNARTPLTDKLARGNLTAAFEVVRTLADGGTYENAHTAMTEAFDRGITYWKTQNVPGASFVISSLMFDKEHAVQLGNESATVSDPVPAPVITTPVMIGTGIGLAAAIYAILKKDGTP